MATSNFDPTKFGAKPVSTFDPAALGAKPAAAPAPPANHLNGFSLMDKPRNALEPIVARTISGKQTPIDALIQILGATAEGVINKPVSKVFEATGISKVLGTIIDKVGGAVDSASAKIGTVLRDKVGPEHADEAVAKIDAFLNHPKVKPYLDQIQAVANDPQVLGDLKALRQIGEAAATVVGASEGASAAKNAAKEAISPVLAERRVANLARDAKAVDDLAGTIVQGKKGDIAAARKSLSSIDTADVKTYTDLKHVLDEKIGNISGKLDEALSTSGEARKLDDLTLSSKVGESTVAHNFVEDSIQQLKDHYQATNDVKGLETINQLEAKAQSQGLTAKDINDLAKVHGRDLNAFNANGQAASGLSKQAAENTRVGLKSTAREMFDNPTYKAADVEVSKLIKTRDLVAKMEEEVQKLSQKIKTRSWGEKAGRLAGQVFNLLGANTPKGFVEYFLSRGTGLKTLNALDLESSLAKNLRRLQKALGSNAPEADVIEQLQQIIDDSASPQKKGTQTP